MDMNLHQCEICTTCLQSCLRSTKSENYENWH